MAAKTKSKQGANKRKNYGKSIKRKNSARPRAARNPLDTWIEYLVYALVILVPLTFSRVTFDQFDIAKMTVFRVLTLAALVLWLIKLLTYKSVNIVWTKWDLFLAGFLTLALASTFTSIHVFSSLQGKYKRYEGLYTFLNYAVIYLLTLQVFKDKHQVARLSRIISYTALAVAAYGLIQYIGLDPINWGATPFEARSSFSTFGNPDLLGAYLALTLPITLANFIGYKDRLKTVLFGVGYFLVAASLLTTYTRGAWLGGLVGVAVLFALIGFKRLKVYLPKLLVVHLIFFLFFVGVLVYSATSAPPGVMNLSSRIKSMSQISGGTVGTRIEIWKAGLGMIKDRPLLGQGLGTYRLASEHFETLKYVKMVRGRTVADNAHNYIVQMTAGAGIPAALAFFTFILGILYFSITSIRRRQHDSDDFDAGGTLTAAGLTAGALGYFVYLLAGISVVGSSGIFWIILAVLIGQTTMKKNWVRAAAALPLNLSLAAVMLTVMLLGTATMVKMYAADYMFVQFYRQSSINLYNKAIASANQAFALYPNGRYQSDLGRFFMQSQSPSLDLTDRAIIVYKKAVASEPLEADYRVFLANSYAIKYSLSRQKDRVEYLNRAISELNKVVDRRPHSVPANFLLGRYSLPLQKNDLSLKYLRKVEDIDPDFPNLYSNLAQAYKQSGKAKMAEYYAGKAATTNSP